MISALTTPLISSAAMRGIFEDRARLQRMLDFEVALARAQAALGVIPTLATDKIVQAARPERYDLARLGEDATSTGDIGITLVNALARPKSPRRIPKLPPMCIGAQPARISSTRR